METHIEMKRFKASFFLTVRLLSCSCAIATSSRFASSSSLSHGIFACQSIYGKTLANIHLLPHTKKALWSKCFQTCIRHGVSALHDCSSACPRVLQSIYPCHSPFSAVLLWLLLSLYWSLYSDGFRGQAESMSVLFHEYIPLDMLMARVV